MGFVYATVEYEWYDIYIYISSPLVVCMVDILQTKSIIKKWKLIIIHGSS